MKRHHPISKFYILFLFFLIIGCSKVNHPSPLSLTAAQQKLIQVCKEEYGLPVTIKPLENTVWIYLPLEESFFQFKVSEEAPAPSAPSGQATPKPAINFIDGKFEENQFKISYDISSSKTYAKDFGFSSQYTESYQLAQRNLLTSISRAYTDVKPGEKAPDFFILMIADIKNGIESRTTLAFPDLKRAMEDASFYEEYVKRIISDYPVGNKKIIGDKTGRHLEIKELTWPEFLIKQIVYRVQFQYQRSSFPPSQDPKPEILKVVSETLRAYNFTNFDAVELTDLAAGATETVPK